MLTSRVIVCLDVAGDRVVKGVEFVDLRDVGDPVLLAERYEGEGADEIVFLDIGAASEGRSTLLDTARRTAERLFIPLTIGGGIADVGDVGRALRAGADKVSINSAAIRRPALLTEAAERFGAQCVVASIDARREPGGGWRVYARGGREETALDVVAWARECADRGAGEVLLTSIDRDGARTGYDVALTRAVADRVHVPVVASGGAGEPEHMVAAIVEGGADAVLAASIFHRDIHSIAAVKSALAAAGVPVRPVSAAA